jgi:hypothetical protein
LAKLLGAPFGLELIIEDVDTFLFEKIKTKLDYWISIHLSLASGVVISNSVLLSTLYSFISFFWGGLYR